MDSRNASVLRLFYLDRELIRQQTHDLQKIIFHLKFFGVCGIIYRETPIGTFVGLRNTVISSFCPQKSGETAIKSVFP